MVSRARLKHRIKQGNINISVTWTNGKCVVMSRVKGHTNITSLTSVHVRSIDYQYKSICLLAEPMHSLSQFWSRGIRIRRNEFVNLWLSICYRLRPSFCLGGRVESDQVKGGGAMLNTHTTANSCK